MINKTINKLLRTIFISDFIYSILKGLILISTLKFTYEETNNLILIGLSLLFEVISGTIFPLLWGSISNKRNLSYYYSILIIITVILSFILLFIFLIFNFKVYILLLIYNMILSLIDPLRRITVHSSFAKYLKKKKKLFFNSIHQLVIQVSQILTLISTYYYLDNINPNYIIYAFNLLIILLLTLVFNKKLFKSKASHNTINIKDILIDNYSLFIKYNTIVIVCVFDFIYLNIFNLLLPIFYKSYSLGSTISILDLSFSIGGAVVSLLINKVININSNGFNFVLLKTILVPIILISMLLYNSYIIIIILSFLYGFLLLGSIIYLNTYLQRHVNKSHISNILGVRKFFLSIILFILIPLYGYISTAKIVNLYIYSIPIIIIFFISIFYLVKFKQQENF